MRYVIRPKGESIIAWLLKFGEIAADTPPRTHIRDRTHVAVCLHKMPYGPEARICYSGLELHDARCACTRIITNKWFWVPIEAVKPFMHGQEIR